MSINSKKLRLIQKLAVGQSGSVKHGDIVKAFKAAGAKCVLSSDSLGTVVSFNDISAFVQNDRKKGSKNSYSRHQGNNVANDIKAMAQALLEENSPGSNATG